MYQCLLCVSDVPVTIERKRGSGLFGTVSVAYTTLSPSESYPFLPPLDAMTRRADYDDFDPASGTVTFTPGQTNASVNVSIKASNKSQPDSIVFLRLYKVVLAQSQQLRPGTSMHTGVLHCIPTLSVSL